MPLPLPLGLLLFLPVQGNACASLCRVLSWGHTGRHAPASQPLVSLQGCTVYQHGVGLFPHGQFCHCKAVGIMKVGPQSMVEVVFLQIPHPIRKALRVHMLNHCDSVVYVEHVLLHSFVLLLLDLIQCSYHGIIVALVTKCLLHVYQQVLHRDILAFVHSVAHLPGYPWRLAKI